MEVVNRRLYRHAGKALLRAARAPVQSRPKEWPDLTNYTDVDNWRVWLLDVWSRTETAEAITLASPALAWRVEEICAGTHVKAKDIRRAVISVARYVLRETARPTPFGLFAGVACVEFGATAKACWGRHHRPLARVDAEWLGDVITRMEACSPLLERLPVTISNLRSVRGDRLVLPGGSGRVEIRYTPAVRVVERCAHSPIRFGTLADALAEEFPTASPLMICGMLTELVGQRFLVTSLRPPVTVTDVLAHVIDQLREVAADDVAQVAPTVCELRAIKADLDRHNHAGPGERGQARASAAQRMMGLSRAAKSPLAVDLRLDCDVQLPHSVAQEMEVAASTLLHLTAQPGGFQAWHDYNFAFLERYGIGTLVPVIELIDPDIGLGFPAGYPGSLFDPPAQPSPSARDDRLLALVHHAALEGRDDIVLTDDTISGLVAGALEAARIPPHVELSARIHAESQDALDRGEFTLTVSPARAAGTMTGRFTSDASTGMAEVFQGLPTNTTDAIPAQLSFPPVYPHAENVARTPQFLSHVIALGEHRTPGQDGMISLDDLAVTADWNQMHLVSLSLRRPVEPQVFHALRLDKQFPAVARFLATLPRGCTAAYAEFDWGAASNLPHLPRVRYGRAVLSPARWMITANELPTGNNWSVWRSALGQWQNRWRLPDTVELRDADRMLRLDLTEPAHAAILRAHLDRSGHAVLTEAPDEAGHGWLAGHAHEVAVPLMSTRPTAQCPLTSGRPLVQVANSAYGHLPGSPESEWFFAKVYIHPERQSEVIAGHLPRLLASLGGNPQWWFLRYRDPHDPDHLRLRIRVTGTEEYGTCAAAVGAWAGRLRREGVVRRLVLDTYYPQVGRYGAGVSMAAAEAVFAADSEAVVAQLVQFPEGAAHPSAIAAANFAAIAAGFTGSLKDGMEWLIDRAKDLRAAPAPREVFDQAVALATREDAIPGWETLAPAWEARRVVLATYRTQLSAEADADAVLESLLHMHHIRAVGLNRDSERVCRRLARSAALAWRAKKEHQ